MKNKLNKHKQSECDKCKLLCEMLCKIIIIVIFALLLELIFKIIGFHNYYAGLIVGGVIMILSEKI